MAGFCVRRGSEEAPPWFFRQRLLGFLTLLFLVLARSASAGVLVRERTDDGGNRGRDYLQTVRSDDSSSQWNVIRLNVSIAELFGWQRPDDSRTRDRGNLFTSNNNKYYNYGNYGNDRRGSTSTGVADKGKYDEALMKHYLNSLDDENTLKTLLKDPPVKTLDSFPTERPTYVRRRIVIPVGLIMFLLSSCLYGCARVFGRKEEQQEEVRERPQVLLRLLVPVERPPAAEDETETQDQDTEAPPTYSDALKSEPPPAYSEVCTKET